MSNTLTKTDKQIQKIKEAQGYTRALVVGVSNYGKRSGYGKLSQCINDATAVHKCFEEVHQLNAPKAFLHLLLDASKGDIIAAVKDLAAAADAKDRIFFFFSGHGERIGEKFYLVPKDAWSSEEPDALVDFDLVKSLLSGARAKHKIVMLDACYSGPDTTTLKKKSDSRPVSKGFLEKMLTGSSGTVMISSSSDSESSTTKSPDRAYSLFSYYLLKCLRGEPESLENNLLTSESLFKYLSPEVMRYSMSCAKPQTPIKSETTSGFCFIFGDFSPIVSTATLNLGQNSTGLSFYETERLKIDEIFTREDAREFDFESLTEALNYFIPKYYEDDMGKYRADLNTALNIRWKDLEIDGTSLYFDDGNFEITFSAEGEKYVIVRKEISFGQDWYEHPEKVLAAIDLIDLSPEHIVIHLKTEVKLEDFADDIQSQGWAIASFTNSKIVAKSGIRTAIITAKYLDFTGFSPEDVVQLNSHVVDSTMISTVYALVEQHKVPILPGRRGRR